MKKKSFFGINVKLALMLVAICGMFASCYEKEELKVEKPGSTEAPVYEITGVVYDATTGTALSGVSVNGAVTTGADGTYSLTSKSNGIKAGLNVLTFSKNDFQTVTTSIYVVAIENGETAVYKADAAMYSNKEVTYKQQQYSIEGKVVNEKGEAVALTSAIFNGGLQAAISGNAYTLDNVQPGTYNGVLSAKGYKNAYITVNVLAAALEEGATTDIQKIVTSFDALMQKEDVVTTKYLISGIITNKDGEFLKGANVAVQVNGFNTQTTSVNYGYYSVEVPAENVAPGSLAVITVALAPYKTQTKAQIMTVVEAGATSALSVPFEMTVPEGTSDPEVDKDNGGNANVTVDVENAESTKAEDIKDVDVKNSVEKIAEDLGIDLKTQEVPVVTAENPVTVELISTETIINEATGEPTQDTKTVSDQIVLPANTQIYYVAGTAQNISVTRDITTEKATAAVRTYEGQPSGVVFSQPMEIKFPAPVEVTTEPDYVLSVLYLDENTNKWVADNNNYAEYDMTSKAFVGSISHFSKFRFGYESEVSATDSKPMDEIIINKPCYTGSSSAIVTVKGKYMGGAMYDGNTPDLAVDAALHSMNPESKKYVSLLLKNMIRTDNSNIMPENSYKNTDVSVDIFIAANRQVKNFSMVRNEVVKTYTVQVIDKDKNTIEVSVKVKKVVSVTITANDEVSHGHGHGTDLNSGGGIIDFE